MSRLPDQHATLPAMERAALNLQQLAASGALPPGDASALALTALAQEIGPFLDPQYLRGRIAAYFVQLRSRHAEKARLRNHLGVDLPLTPEECARMGAEVRRFQWIEAERAGRNIWVERDASNPDAAATAEWFRRHFGAWYLHARQGLGGGRG